nr:unnamed protein product [Digitaria exilis]
MTMYVLARAFYELEERLPKMQEKVRNELKNKGYVEVDDEYHKRKAEGLLRPLATASEAAAALSTGEVRTMKPWPTRVPGDHQPCSLKECAAAGRDDEGGGEDASAAGSAPMEVAGTEASAAGEPDVDAGDPIYPEPKPPTQWPSPYHELRESNPSLVPLTGEEMDDERRELYATAKEFQRMEEDDAKLREWVRNEMETKRYVEMDDDWVRRRAEVSAIAEEAMKKARALLINDTEEEDSDDENDCGGGDNDDDDDGEFYF